jgi:hypothetical protein
MYSLWYQSLHGVYKISPMRNKKMNGGPATGKGREAADKTEQEKFLLL